MDVFILNSAHDQVVASRLRDALLGRDFTVGCGTDADALRSARAVVVVWSPSAVREPAIVRLAGAARRRGRLLQTKAKPCDVPSRFGTVDGVILDGWSGDPADNRFQLIHAGVRSLVEGVGPGQARPPSGLAWRDRSGRGPLLWSIALISGLGATIGVVQNLNAAKTGLCRIDGAYSVCRRIGWAGPPPSDVLSRIEGRWSDDNCRASFADFRASQDGSSLVLTAGGQSATAEVDGRTESELSLIYRTPDGQLEDWKIVLDGDQMTLRELRDGAWGVTRLVRCAS